MQDHFSLAPGDDMIGYDNEITYAGDMYSDAAITLELKSNIGSLPTWMLDLITTFSLKQQGFSKYLSSSLVSRLDDGDAYINADRKLRHYNCR